MLLSVVSFCFVFVFSQVPPLMLPSSLMQVLYTTVCVDHDFASDGSFAPLQINYTERFSAAGRTSGSFFKRDSKQKENEVLVSRLVDRPIRPMITEGWPHSTQILQWVLSYDF